ncbi:MAG: HAMP domain-containing histidine kinase [Ruminococcus sp.]|nr:HAMP domain-containing histidine kinase [Ruminococcus sp.]
MVYGLLCIIIIALCVKIYLMKRSAREIANEFADRLQTDTNTLICISSHDKDMCQLADRINVQLKELRKEHLQYHQGNTELKNAVTNISHDLRTPLTAIAGDLYMIEKTDDLTEIREYIAAIEERTKAMKQLTEELFRYSVIVSSEGETVTEEVFVNQVLAESIAGFYPVLTEKGITPQIHITDTRIVRDISRSDLMRVFSNLLNNAVKYSDGDLEITLSDTGEITFTNTAKELSAVEVEQLFDRFYTVEAAHHSTGLGLSIARTLVERMGGAITANLENSRLTIRIVL